MIWLFGAYRRQVGSAVDRLQLTCNHRWHSVTLMGREETGKPAFCTASALNYQSPLGPAIAEVALEAEDITAATHVSPLLRRHLSVLRTQLLVLQRRARRASHRELVCLRERAQPPAERGVRLGVHRLSQLLTRGVGRADGGAVRPRARRVGARVGGRAAARMKPVRAVVNAPPDSWGWGAPRAVLPDLRQVALRRWR